MCIIPTFFHPVQTSFLELLLFDVMPKSKKGDEFGPYAFKTFLDARVLFQMWIIWKISTIILFKRNMTEKDVILWTLIFLFVQTFYTIDDS